MTISCVTYPERQQRRRVRQTIATHKGKDNNNNTVPNPQRHIRTWCFILWFTTCGVMVIISLLIGYMISSSDQDTNNTNHRIHSIQHPFRRQQQQSQSQHDDRTSTTEHRPISSLENADENHSKQKKEERILYIVTSIAEYDNGLRSTIEGNDRFTNTLVPVLLESVQSILSTPSSSSFNHNIIMCDSDSY